MLPGEIRSLLTSVPFAAWEPVGRGASARQAFTRSGPPAPRTAPRPGWAKPPLAVLGSSWLGIGAGLLVRLGFWAAGSPATMAIRASGRLLLRRNAAAQGNEGRTVPVVTPGRVRRCGAPAERGCASSPS
ncbi:hypothetical protein [Streptomyces sp. RB17]|uniref:hypothetical protein n=1 Tax=Streptomyces sp. RB17 TaxID=2585197 RepID=UPI00129802AB|nr:hypothetical protein [Streptomyces sp. RB17]